jgi:hypothetical protein
MPLRAPGPFPRRTKIGTLLTYYDTSGQILTVPARWRGLIRSLQILNIATAISPDDMTVER